MEPIRNFSEMKIRARELPSKTVSVVRADEVETLIAVREAVHSDMLDAILVGPETEIRRCAEEAEFDLNGIRIIDVPDDVSASAQGVKLVRDDEAQVLLKGFVASSTYLKAILDREHGIRTDSLLSHVTAFDIPNYDKRSRLRPEGDDPEERCNRCESPRYRSSKVHVRMCQGGPIRQDASYD